MVDVLACTEVITGSQTLLGAIVRSVFALALLVGVVGAPLLFARVARNRADAAGEPRLRYDLWGNVLP